jgi:hypothetical protein
LHSPAGFDPDLQRVLDAWPILPPAIRAAVLALIGAAAPHATEPPRRPTSKPKGKRRRAP